MKIIFLCAVYTLLCSFDIPLLESQAAQAESALLLRPLRCCFPVRTRSERYEASSSSPGCTTLPLRTHTSGK